MKRKWPPWLVFALKVVYACACGLFIGFLWTTFSRPFGMMRQMQTTLLEEQNLPGAAELRSDGCQQVIVSTPALRAAHSPSHGRGGKGNETWITCMPLLLRAAPTCDRLARHYVTVAHPSGPLTVIVQGPTAKSNCRERFDSSGLPLASSGDGGL